ncbi:MAG: peptidoglycan DD-metalloendopeptidase family protein [Methylococcales bacterium]
MTIKSVTQTFSVGIEQPDKLITRNLAHIMLVLLLMTGCNQSLKRTPLSQSLAHYTVVKGDTLYSIALRAGVKIDQLIDLNDLAKPYTLFPGQTIHLKPKNRVFKATSRRYKNHPRTHRLQARKPTNSDNKNTYIAENSKNPLKIRWHWPLTGVVVKSFNQSGRKGIDIAGKLGDTVLAAASGKVVYSGLGLLGYGNLIVIRHDSHYLTAYANNRRLFVKQGQVVRQGQKIAEVGQLSEIKPSLHFEIRRDGKPINPLSYLPKR